MNTDSSFSITSIFQKTALGIMLLMWLYCILQYGSLPDKIPLHFGLSGQPNNWGARQMVFILPIVALFCYVLMTVLPKRFSGFFNYPVKITENNKAIQLALAKEQLQAINLICMVMLAQLCFGIIQVAKGNQTSVGVWFTLSMLGLMFLTIWYYYRKAKEQA